MPCIGRREILQLSSWIASASTLDLEQLSLMRYDHLVTIDESTRELVIYRLDANGRRTLFTKTRLPDTQGWSRETNRLAQELGENLLMDSEAARRLLLL